MATSKDLPTFVVNYLTQTQYDTAKQAGTLDEDQLYLTPDTGGGASGTVTSIGVQNATNGGISVSGSPITTSGTITVGHSNVLTSAQTTQAVYPIKIDKNGHVSEYGNAVTSMPASDVYSWAKAENKPSYTYSDVGAAASSHSHGNITSGGDITATAPTIANGDQIIINDNSASKITNGPTFDGTTTTTALTPKGTWESFAKSDTNTTYTLTNTLSSHKFTWTFTAGGSGSGSTTTTAELANGTGISLSDDTTNKKITINHSNSVTAKSTQAVYPITFDAQGHITGSGTAVTIPTVPGVATSSTAGLVKPWKSYSGASSGPTAATGTTAPTINSISNTSGKYYAVEMDVNGRMFVNVPWSAGGDVPSTTGSATTGITISAHSTGTVRGVKSNTNTTASKASGGNGSAPSLTVTSTTVADSITGAIDSSDSTMLVISLGTTSVGSASGWSAGSASTWSFTDVTVPIRADSDSTFVTGTTHTVTDPGHTHSV